MGYSRSVNMVMRMAGALDKLVAGAGTVYLSAENPVKLAWQIRSAMHAAKVNDVEKYKDLGWQWQINTDFDQGVVVCKRHEHAMGPDTFAKRVELPVGTHCSVFIDQIRESGENHEAFKMRGEMPNDQTLALWNWLQNSSLSWEIIVSDAGVIVTREEGFAGQGWSPSV